MSSHLLIAMESSPLVEADADSNTRRDWPSNPTRFNWHEQMLSSRCYSPRTAALHVRPIRFPDSNCYPTNITCNRRSESILTLSRARYASPVVTTDSPCHKHGSSGCEADTAPSGGNIGFLGPHSLTGEPARNYA